MLITNANVITMGTTPKIIDDQAILMSKGKISQIGNSSLLEAEHPQEQKLDAMGQYVMPGNICAHTHFYGAFARGMAIMGDAPSAFPEILERLWWSLDRALDLEAVKYSTLVCLIDAIKHGTTCLLDHHASPNAIEGSLDVIAEAVSQAGLRASLCYEVTDRNGVEGARSGLAENIRFINRLQADRKQRSKLHGMVGLHASLTLSDETLESCRKAVGENVGFHIHVAEHSVDQYDSLKKNGERVVDRLNRHGILGEKSIAVHGVHLDAKEIMTLAATNTWVTHQPRSNMNNAVGLPQVEAMLRAGVKVCIGNDGFSNAMWEEWKTTYLAHKLWHLDPRRMNGMDVLKMGVDNNRHLVNSLFDDVRVGIVEPGANADLIFVDYHPFTPLTVENLPWHILFGFQESMITATIVDGVVLMENRTLKLLDEEKISFEARKVAERVWTNYRKFFERE